MSPENLAVIHKVYEAMVRHRVRGAVGGAEVERDEARAAAARA